MHEDIKILYVEDDDEIRGELLEILELDFAHIAVANNGKEGLDLYKKQKPDLVISDIQMPQMDGLAMCKQIREFSSDLPIILTTAFNEPSYQEAVQELDNTFFVTKPINMDELYVAIKASLQQIAKMRLS